MGRNILESGRLVYTYNFGIQNSELYRIATEFHIGKLESTPPWEDLLTLTRDDITQLKTVYKKHEKEVKEWNNFEQKLCPDGSLPYGSIQEKKYREKMISIPNIFFWVMVKSILIYTENFPEREIFRFVSQLL